MTPIIFQRITAIITSTPHLRFYQKAECLAPRWLARRSDTMLKRHRWHAPRHYLAMLYTRRRHAE